MVQNKLNVFHWHLSDDQSFPLFLPSFPDFAANAAYSKEQIYSAEDVAEIVEYGRVRGIRVMPEIDTPSHVLSWRHLPVDILTRCYDASGKPNGDLGPLDPSKEKTYKVMEKIFHDLSSMFNDSYFHAGGDEVPLDCWRTNPNITKFRELLWEKKQSKKHQSSDINQINQINDSGNKVRVEDLVNFYSKQLMKAFRRSYGKERSRMIMWEEAWENDPKVSKDIILHVWKNNQMTVKMLTDLGYQVLFSQCWYLNYISYGVDWPKYYLCDPTSMSPGGMSEFFFILFSFVSMIVIFFGN